MKRASWILIALFLCLNTQGQKRFKNTVFQTIDSVTDITYGEAINLKGKKETLVLDVIKPPDQDTMKYRPLLIFIHGGGFVSNTRKGGFGKNVCQSFAKRGYVTATIDYRLGVAETKTDKDYYEALYRAQQDGRAAVRFFRKYADLYRIDTSQIFITGTSAGSKTCLAIAYMNEGEVPSVIDQKKWGSLEGESGNSGYSSSVHGVLNNWGCLIDYKWINSGDAPLFNLAGTEDKTVPYDSSYSWHGMKYGSYILFQRCLEMGVATGWRPFLQTGHTLDNNKQKQDSAVLDMANWLYTQLKYPSGPVSRKMKWADDIDRFDSLNKTETHGKNALLFIGSSYIRMWKNIRTDLHQKDIIHRGFGGCNLRDVAYYIKRIAYPHQPKAIFIYVGNDITAGEKDKTPDQVLELFKYVVKQLRTKFPNTPITWLEISPSEKRWLVWDKITEANRLIREYCNNESKLYYISFSSHFLGNDGKPISSLYLEDKLHYNESGYKVWGKAIQKQVKKISQR